MLEIENHKVEFMSESGSTILHVMHSSIPILDMLVREAVQNSFDAKIDGAEFITERINCGHFNKTLLCNKFEGINNKLLSIDSKKNYFISFGDSNTTGLTGTVKKEEIDINDWGKFLNLVRNVGKTNKHTEAGGSWGYGKTVFYRAGIGLVIYYTRISTGVDCYEERLMACVVENEKNPYGLLTNIQKGQNTGVAWWGKKENGILLPITNHEEIVSILDCFNLKPYSNMETGTLVIIPFIDDEALLNETMASNIGDDDVPGWCSDLESYLDIAFQRWYPTRYANTILGSNYIEVYINDEKKDANNMYPLFKTIQGLYNYGINNKNLPDFSVASFSTDVIKPQMDEKSLGTFYYTLLSKHDLRMEIPYEYESPFAQIKNELEEPEKEDKVIVSFCRKPGMILKYDVDEAWSAGIITPNKDEYLIGLYIPNSKNSMIIDGRKITVENYLRASERAEHNDWNDINEFSFEDGYIVKTSHCRFVEKIQKKIRSKINELSTNVVEKPLEHFSGSKLSRKFATLFLPKYGFGNIPDDAPPGKDGGKKSTGDKKPTIKRNKKSKIIFGQLEVSQDGKLSKHFEIILSKDSINFDFEFKVSTETGEIEANKWEEDLDFPVCLNDIYIDNYVNVDGQTKSINTTITNDSKIEDIELFKKVTTRTKSWYGIDLKFNSKIEKIVGKISYTCSDKSVMTSISVGKEGK